MDQAQARQIRWPPGTFSQPGRFRYSARGNGFELADLPLADADGRITGGSVKRPDWLGAFSATGGFAALSLLNPSGSEFVIALVLAVVIGWQGLYSP